jgi:hypothetical protein
VTDTACRWPMTETLMPGGGVARRPLHFIVIADCSGSMKGEKMQALNYALRSMLPHLVTWERDQLQAQLLIRILTFATVPHWHIADPLPVVDSTDDIVDRLVAASIAVSRMSEEGADTEALAQALTHPPAGPAPGPPADSIL